MNLEGGTAYSLTPLLFWHTLRGESEPTVAVLDQLTDASQAFKTSDGGYEIVLEDHAELADLRNYCLESLRGDIHRELRNNLVFIYK